MGLVNEILSRIMSTSIRRTVRSSRTLFDPFDTFVDVIGSWQGLSGGVNREASETSRHRHVRWRTSVQMSHLRGDRFVSPKDQSLLVVVFDHLCLFRGVYRGKKLPIMFRFPVARPLIVVCFPSTQTSGTLCSSRTEPLLNDIVQVLFACTHSPTPTPP